MTSDEASADCRVSSALCPSRYSSLVTQHSGLLIHTFVVSLQRRQPGVAGEFGPPVGELEGAHRLVEGGEPIGVGIDGTLRDQANLDAVLVGEAQPALA